MDGRELFERETEIVNRVNWKALKLNREQSKENCYSREQLVNVSLFRLYYSNQN